MTTIKVGANGRYECWDCLHSAFGRDRVRHDYRCRNTDGAAVRLVAAQFQWQLNVGDQRRFGSTEMRWG